MCACCWLRRRWRHRRIPTPHRLPIRPHDPLNLTAFNHFYNLDYDRAVQEFEQVLARHPDDPFAVNHLLTATLFRELYRMGVLNTGEYANDSFISAPHRPADPKVKQQIKDLVDRALQLEEKRLAANPNDVDALVRPRRDPGPVRHLHRADRTRLVFGLAECRGGAPRS